MKAIPTAEEWRELAMATAGPEATSPDPGRWDAMAPTYAHKPRRSDYLTQLQEMLDARLRPGESVFDMGCGPGVMALPLAHAGHDVVAVDFSDGMLAQLEASVAAEGLKGKVRAFKRAWQDDWADLPVADVALSSRSMTTRDFADAVESASLLYFQVQSVSSVTVYSPVGICSMVTESTPWISTNMLRSSPWTR